MEEVKQNKMAVEPLKKLFWKMGLPMIISMVLQALYNVVDSIFVSNIEGVGALANQALTYAFPIQILMIAIGVGTGVGINAVLSKSLGMKDKDTTNKVAGNGIFLSGVIYLVFLIFGLFGSNWFVSLFTSNEQVIEMGATYLRICCCLSLGSIGYTVYERFLQATGKTLYSSISQISGAVINIIFDYVFIFPMGMGVAGAAWATVFGQFVSLIVAMLFHYITNKEISANLKYIKPSWKIIKNIYKIGISAAIMQGLMSVMMAGMNAILGLSKNVDTTILIGSFGIYFKIQQIALLSAFGLSNTIITILSFNYGMKDKKRVKDCVKYGITDSIIVAGIITILFEIIANPLSRLFALSDSGSSALISTCETATRIGAISFVFMAYTVAIQGVLQALGYAGKPLILALLRYVVFVFPVAYLFTLSNNVINIVWWTFLIAEICTCVFSFIFLRKAEKLKISILPDEKIDNQNLIITIAREHGTNGKQIGKLVAEKLGIEFFDKELVLMQAKQNNAENDVDVGQIQPSEEDYNLYLSLDANKDAIIAQSQIIRQLADSGKSFVIVGRSADSVLKNYNTIKIFIHAPMEYKIANVEKLYGDTPAEAEKHILKSDKARAKYYEIISNQKWGDSSNFDLTIDASVGNEQVVNSICDFVQSKKIIKQA